MQSIIYQSPEGELQLDIKLHNNTVWLDIKQIAELFESELSVINQTITNIYKIGELNRAESSLMIGDTDFPRLFEEGPKTLFNLAMVLAIGYRIPSTEAVRFRKWATSIIRDYMTKGYSINREKVMSDLRNLSELSREIRALRMQKMLSYREIRGILAKASSDYNASSFETSQFYSRAQNLLNYGVAEQTASEIIYSRVNHEKECCGLTYPSSEVPYADEVIVAKNYLYPHELDTMHRLVDSLLSVIEWQIKKGVKMPQVYWLKKIEDLLKIFGLKIWNGVDSIGREQANKKARTELKLFKQKMKEDSRNSNEQAA